MAFELAFKLLGAGWAEATIAFNGSCRTLNVSYLTDALGDLADAVIKILTGDTSEEPDFWWVEEPGAYHWYLTREAPNVRLLVSYVADGMFEGSDESQEGIVIDVVVPAVAIAEQTLRVLDSVRNEYSIDEYARAWINHPYPEKQHAKLRALLAAQKNS